MTFEGLIPDLNVSAGVVFVNKTIIVMAYFMQC